jgi:hypothetical protein
MQKLHDSTLPQNVTVHRHLSDKDAFFYEKTWSKDLPG